MTSSAKYESLSQLVKSLNDIDKVLDFKNEGSVSVNALPMKSWDLMSKAQVSLKNKENLNLPLERYGASNSKHGGNTPI